MSIIKVAGPISFLKKLVGQSKQIANLEKQLEHQHEVTERVRDFARYKAKANTRRGLIYGSLGGGVLAAGAYAAGKNSKKG